MISTRNPHSYPTLENDDKFVGPRKETVNTDFK